MPPADATSSQPIGAGRGFLLRPAEWALVAAIVLAVVLTAFVDANHSYWFQPYASLRDIARNTALLGIFALGATVVIIAGGIDLSSGSMIALSGTVCAATMLLVSPA
jgi:ribose/xylose/arabinose/galactoside ABC-type transport system permease subunit